MLQFQWACFQALTSTPKVTLQASVPKAFINPGFCFGVMINVLNYTLPWEIPTNLEPP